MVINMFKRFTLILLAILLSASLLSCSFPIKKPTAEIVLLHTNDIHGRVVGDETYIIGIDRIAAIHKSIPNSILLDAGDALHGLPVATINGGADIASLMNAAGYSAMVPGNHEFNYGWERLVELRDMAGFPFLASNVTVNGTHLLDDSLIIEIDGVKIGLFGIITEATSYSAMPEFVRAVDFADPVNTAKLKADHLRSQGVHVVVALCHLGDSPSGGTLSTELASALPDHIDVIIDGHSHSELPEGRMENGTLIVQTGGHGNNLGKITISVEEGVITSKTASLITVEEALKFEPDETVAGMLSDIMAGIDKILSLPIGESAIEWSSARSPGVRTQEMPLGSLVADAYRAAADAEIAIANGGDIRADILPGVITMGDVISVLPFGNTLMVKSITPAILFEVLENGVNGIITDDEGNIDIEQSPQGRFPQISGFSFIYDPVAPPGERIVSVTLDDGRELFPDDFSTNLSLAGSNYVMTGGDMYFMLEDLPVQRELGAADEALVNFIRKNSPVDEPPAGRISTYIR